MLAKTIFNILILALILPSCAPNLPKEGKREANLKLPEKFHYQNDETEKKQDTSLKDWRSYFKTEPLSDLINEALGNNQELHILEQEIHIANNEVMASEGEYLPNLNFKAGYESEKVGEHTSQGINDFDARDEDGKRVPEILHNHQVALTTTWELDIWSSLRNSAKAAYKRYLSSIEARKFATTQIVSEVAMNYYELIALDKQLEIIKEFIQLLNQARELVKVQQNAARVTSLAVKRFEAEVLKNESREFEITQKIVEKENYLNFLVGRLPQKIPRDSSQFIDLKLGEIDAGVPVDLLKNRPDIKRVELALMAAKLDVKAAKARFYPALSIEASGGYQAFNSSHLNKSPESIFYNLGVNLTAPLLNRNAIKADYLSADRAQIQAVYEYERTLLVAYNEVVNQLSKITNLESMLSLKTKQVKALTDSIEISNILFRSARVDYIESLLTQREALEEQVELVEVKKEQIAAYVNLYRSLGGGWKQ